VRGALLGLVIGLAVACISFDLDSRRFRCDGSPEVCGEGMRCGAEGYCVPATIDAASPDARDLCPPGTTTCGIGCLCEGGVAREVACADGLDNDEDGLTDCLDADCPCAGGLVCCADGSCAASLAVCPG
jgi:hypothetical protein